MKLYHVRLWLETDEKVVSFVSRVLNSEKDNFGEGLSEVFAKMDNFLFETQLKFKSAKVEIVDDFISGRTQ